MTFEGTPTTPLTLRLYRERHVIERGADYLEDLGRFVQVCKHDGLRIHPREGGWVHDSGQIRDLAAIERGEPIRW